jgi:hemoglobin-like flavoprotein
MTTDLRGVRATGPPEVDPGVLRLLGACTADLAPHQAELVLALHQRLLELTPGIARMAGSGRPMCQRLIAATLHAAQPGRAVAHSAAVVQQVGADNYVEGFPSDQHSSVTHALLHAVREVFRGEWSSPLSSAWVEYLLWFRTHLLTGAQAQRSHDAARAQVQSSAGARAGASADPAPVPGGGDGGYDPFAARPAPAASSPPIERDRFAGDRLVGAAGEPSLPAGATLDDHLDDEDDEDEPAYGGLMMSMTLGSKRDKRGR